MAQFDQQKHRPTFSRYAGSLALVLLMYMPLRAQQDPIYASYLQNPLSINPAYAGHNHMLNSSLQYRTQWAGLEANPTTINFATHMSVYRNQVGVGLMVIQDKLGDNKNTEFQGVFSYKIQVKKAWLSFGMQTGFIRYENTPSMLTIRDPGDPAFTQFTETHFNTGVGVLLKSESLVLGLSAPRLLPATINQGGQSVELYQQTYYLFGSYLWRLSEKVQFRPSVLTRYTAGSPLSYDVNTSFIWREKYTAGLFARQFNTVGILTQAVAGKFRIGYIFEVPVGSTNLHFTTHEITLGFATNLLRFHDLVYKAF